MCQPGWMSFDTHGAVRATILGTAVAVPQRARKELLVAVCRATRAPQHSVNPVTEQNIQLLLASPSTFTKKSNTAKKPRPRHNLHVHVLVGPSQAAYQDRANGHTMLAQVVDVTVSEAHQGLGGGLLVLLHKVRISVVSFNRL